MGNKVKYGYFNVVAHPHSDEIYRMIFKKIVNIVLNIRADRYGAIAPLSDLGDGIISGRILTWTEVDRKTNVVSKKDLEDIPFSEAGIDISSNIGLNAAIFNFALKLEGHTLIVETMNEDRRTLAPKTVESFFKKLFESASFVELEEVRIQSVPLVGTVERALKLPQLRKLVIRLERPNPDEMDDDFEEILREMEEEGVKRHEKILTKAPGVDHITPSERTKKLAEVAAQNGYVHATGRSEGKTINVFTDRLPLEQESDIPEDGTAPTHIRQVAREYVRRR